MDEFLGHFDASLVAKGDISPPETDPNIKETAEKLYDLMDLNKDGNLSGREMKKFLQGHSDSLLMDFFGRDLSTSKRNQKVQVFVTEVGEIDGIAGISKAEFVDAYEKQIAPALKST